MNSKVVFTSRPLQSNCNRGYCGEGSDWGRKAQEILAGIEYFDKSGLNVNSQNSYVILSSLPPFGDLFHPRIKVDNTTNLVNFTSYSQCSWEFMDNYIDGGFDYTSATEIGTKMNSRQCSFVYGLNRTKDATPLTIDTDMNWCAFINREAYKWALNVTPNETLTRYHDYGQKLNFVNDDVKTNGFSWTYSVVSYTLNKDTDDIDVSSATMITSIDAKPVPIFAPDGSDCYHYCKLMSPARAIEWIYVDSLRSKYTI